MSLFEQAARSGAEPLAYRMRPASLSEFSGQEHAVGENSFLRKALAEGKVPSVIFWGPPGSGKTTLAMLIAKHVNADFVPLSAVASGIKEVKALIEEARVNLRVGRKTILFVDEIHRFNKAQQDAFLPYVEDGTIVLIGATTENPSFELNSALLSRAKVVVLHRLDEEAIKAIVMRAVTDQARGLGKKKITVDEDALAAISMVSAGDARVALNIVEMTDMVKASDSYAVTAEDVKTVMERKNLLYDREGEEHYNIISALHKSMRGSDPDAALYWLARMLEAGEEPLYIARRMVRFASEDIGNADPQALIVAIAAKDAFDFLGHPEGELALAQAAVYLATAPKSNSCYTGFGAAIEDVNKYRDEPVPMHIRNAPTGLMKGLGYGKGYKYAHDYKNNFVEQDYLPDKLKGRKYYEPTENGMEKGIKERLEKWRKKSG